MRTNYFKSSNPGPSPRFATGADHAQRDTMRAWEGFVENGIASEQARKSVRSEILESWERCSDLGISAASNATPQKVDEDGVTALRSKNNCLVTAARAAFERLSPHLNESGAIMILADNTGAIIETIGDFKTLDAGRDIRLEVGGVWKESLIGTNGIGTALRTGKPTYVHASEHFCVGIKAWTCAGVPVFDPLDRSIVGVVDLSGPPDIFQRHNLALVVAAAREIEIALAEQQREERTLLLEAFIDLPKPRDNDDAIVLLNSAGRIVFSRNADKDSQGKPDDLVVGRHLMSLDASMTDGDLAAALPAGLTAKAIDILKTGNTLRGAVLILPSGKASPRRPKPAEIRIRPRRGIQEDDIHIIGDCPKMLETFEFARRAALAKATVLIQGETGVGKELFARLIHSHHPAPDAPYVAVNCAAISGELIGGELFGHVAGAFTGALREGKPGRFENANNGVLCLDEIGDMPRELQTYLLRTLEQRAVYRIGCNKRRPIDVQLVAMTNRNLRHDIEEGRFRRDLFYRIGTIVINVPPLRERGRDLDLLIDHFNHKLCARFERAPLVFDDQAMTVLRGYSWPGNVRELRNVVERLCLLHGDGIVSVMNLPEEIREPGSDRFLPGDGPRNAGTSMDLDEIESVAIQRAIEQENGNLTKVATVLGISRPTLYRKIRQYGLERRK